MSKPVTRIRWAAGRQAFMTLAVCVVVLSAACTPTVKVATDEPITINLNVNIKHEIRVKVDKELDDIFSEDSDLF
jgi:low affinity Fe/Cu permease